MNDHNDYVEQEAQEGSMKVPVKRQLAILALILLLIFGSGYIPKLLRSFEPSEEQQAAEVSQTLPVPPAAEQDDVDPFEEVTVRAEAAYVWDVQEQRALYTKNPDEQLPLASITKLMTALVAYELLAGTSGVSISDEAIGQDGNSGLLGGESFALSNLLDLTLLSSSNDGAFAIASAAGALLATEGDVATFVEAMNIRASELGLTQTYFRNPTGLDISETESGSYGSARDVTFLMEHILSHYPEILEATKNGATTIASDTGAAHVAENTNPVTSRIPGIIGSKTGYTDLAGGNLTVAFDAAMNRPVIVVVLGSTRTGRFEDVLTLVDSAREHIQQ